MLIRKADASRSSWGARPLSLAAACYKPLRLEELPVVMRVRFALALALWATFQSAASPVAVNARTPSPVVLNVGPSCAEWLETRQAPYSIYEGYNEGFIVGVLNGMSIASGVSLWRNPQGPLRREQVYYWVDEYCRKYPLNDLMMALVAFAQEVSQGAYGQAVERK
jgi:hypothetical protein